VRVSSDFSYGVTKDPLKGTLAVRFIPNCKTGDCNPSVQLSFGALDASAVQAALLGPQEQKSLLSPIMDRMRSADFAKWPAITLTLSADSLALGSGALMKPVARLRAGGSELVVESWQAATLGGSAQGSGAVGWADGKPSYSFEGTFSHLNPATVATLLGNRWKDGSLDGSGKVKLSGLNQKDILASANGELQFQWSNGSIVTVAQQPVHFESWSGNAVLQAGIAELQKNTLILGKQNISVAGTIPFGGPAKLTVGAGTSSETSAGTTAAAKEAAHHANPPIAKPLR